MFRLTIKSVKITSRKIYIPVQIENVRFHYQQITRMNVHYKHIVAVVCRNTHAKFNIKFP